MDLESFDRCSLVGDVVAAEKNCDTWTSTPRGASYSRPGAAESGEGRAAGAAAPAGRNGARQKYVLPPPPSQAAKHILKFKFKYLFILVSHEI